MNMYNVNTCARILLVLALFAVHLQCDGQTGHLIDMNWQPGDGSRERYFGSQPGRSGTFTRGETEQGPGHGPLLQLRFQAHPGAVGREARRLVDEVRRLRALNASAALVTPTEMTGGEVNQLHQVLLDEAVDALATVPHALSSDRVNVRLGQTGSAGVALPEAGTSPTEDALVASGTSLPATGTIALPPPIASATIASPTPLASAGAPQ